MQRMVGHPISLAQHEFKRQAKEEGLDASYSEFLATTLQVPEAMDDYDRFFACRRATIGAERYLRTLTDSLLISDGYISDMAPFAAYRAGLSQAIPELTRLSALRYDGIQQAGPIANASITGSQDHGVVPEFSLGSHDPR